MDVGLFDAWHRWASGELTGQDELWGVPVYWWGRAGRCAEFVGGLAVLAEIVGVERLRAMGMALRGSAQKSLSVRSLVDPVRWLIAMLLYLGSWPGGKLEQRAASQAERYRTDRIYPAITAATVPLGGLVGWYRTNDRPVLTTVVAIAVGLLGGLLVGPVATFVGVFVVQVGRSAIGALALLVALGLDRRAVDVWIKGLALALIAAGFHFDLLAP